MRTTAGLALPYRRHTGSQACTHLLRTATAVVYRRHVAIAFPDVVVRCAKQCAPLSRHTVPVQGLPTAICSQQPGSLPHDVADLHIYTYYSLHSGEEARQRQGSGQG